MTAPSLGQLTITLGIGSFKRSLNPKARFGALCLTCPSFLSQSPSKDLVAPQLCICLLSLEISLCSSLCPYSQHRTDTQNLLVDLFYIIFSLAHLRNPLLCAFCSCLLWADAFLPKNLHIQLMYFLQLTISGYLFFFNSSYCHVSSVSLQSFSKHLLPDTLTYLGQKARAQRDSKRTAAPREKRGGCWRWVGPCRVLLSGWPRAPHLLSIHMREPRWKVRNLEPQKVRAGRDTKIIVSGSLFKFSSNRDF